MNYYGVIRSTDHLAHYGIKGMRWGVRRAIETGNQKALDKHYRKAARKLAKLQDIGNHGYKYAAKAAGYGAAAAGTGALAIGGTGLASKAIRKSAGAARLAGLGLEKFGVNTANRFGTKLSKRPFAKVEQAAKSVETWGKGNTTVPIGIKYKTENGVNVPEGLKGKGISNNKLFRIGAGVATAGLAAKAAQNAYRSRNADKYREKAERFRNEMDDVFANTEYEGSYTKMSRRQQRRRRGY